MFDLMFGWRKASQCKKLMKKLRCRLSLLKNKRCCIVKQLRNDVAQLIKHGHHQTAFHRVDEIYKDECIIAVYDLLAHFCEFLSHQLPYIRRSRDCPNDINEAISSIIFASARCGELPELLRIRKLFSQRYGERFEARALDLLPGNLVNFQIRENLSMISKVPNQVKYKLVEEITTTQGRIYVCVRSSPGYPSTFLTKCNFLFYRRFIC
ncbi:putative vacuolar protein sorting-associated protein Ist1 [Helianthus annuus]|uniref:Vacuolar protein sorting-associated protein Ist1 n=1 Tax=Helianthus annuus TaxID=4232 RepID=A0A251TIU7_HELAN|nr:putative vacuolar protein sorting-associated protein Ist1 [Helianthus annuus]KAJ0513567.1 putative vacuolar protein sorting-associated protein Ist1 [Helianthus annuus]KAJ0521436.1 putative vacuolar protein sorting-associated protein Ist1 [Helianthus annuus]KAJ0529681.1 putative vacuolar protein sorting-associated protein Ist1 [Helianthus annuus]KAJ0696554.1 putative vacuolar protein sorting-associated protein Ist1 [Helianthus annuus]